MYLAGSVCASEPQWLGYRMVEAPTLEMRYIRGVTLNRSGEKPSDDVVPDFNSANPVFFKWESPMVEGGFLWIAFDGDPRYGIGSRCYVDTDCDGRLDDETAVAVKQLDGNRARFSPVKLVFAGEDGPVTYHLLLEFNSHRSRGRLFVCGETTTGRR